MLQINQLNIQLPNFSINLNNTTFPKGLHILVGPNGAGKTSLLNGIIGYGGLVETRAITYNDKELGDMREILSFIPQDNPRFGIRTDDYIRLTNQQNKALDDTDYFDLENILEQPLTTLSGGEFKRVLCAQVHHEDKPLIIADEIESHLDINHKYMIMDWLKKEAETKIVIASVHDLNIAMTYADTLTVMRGGAFLATVTPIKTVDAQLLSTAFNSSIQFIHTDNETLVIRK